MIHSKKYVYFKPKIKDTIKVFHKSISQQKINIYQTLNNSSINSKEPIIKSYIIKLKRKFDRNELYNNRATSYAFNRNNLITNEINLIIPSSNRINKECNEKNNKNMEILSYTQTKRDKKEKSFEKLFNREINQNDDNNKSLSLSIGKSNKIIDNNVKNKKKKIKFSLKKKLLEDRKKIKENSKILTTLFSEKKNKSSLNKNKNKKIKERNYDLYKNNHMINFSNSNSKNSYFNIKQLKNKLSKNQIGKNINDSDYYIENNFYNFYNFN